MKIAIRVILSIFLILVLAIAGLFLYLTDERLKGIVMPQVNETLGREVEVSRISFTLFRTFPNFGLLIQDFSLPDDKGEPVATFDELLVSVRLRPLLSGDIHVNRLEVIRPTARYVVYEDGTTNIDFLLGDPDEEEVAPESTSTIDLNRIVVRDANLRYIDYQSNMSADLNDLDLTMSVRLAEKIQTDVDATLAGLTFRMDGTKYISNLALSLKQTSELDLDQEVLDISRGIFSIRGLALDVTGQVSDWSKDLMSLNLDFASSSDNFGALLDLVPDEYREHVQGIQTRGKLNLTASVSGNLGEDVIPAFNLVLAVEDGFMKHPQAEKPVESVQISISATNDLVQIERFGAKADVNTISLSGKIGAPLSDNPSFELDGDIRIDLGTLEAFYPVSDFGVTLAGIMNIQANGQGFLETVEQTRFSANMLLENGYLKYTEAPKPVEDINIRLIATQDRVTIESLRARASQNQLTMNGVIQNPLDSLRTTFDITANARLDLATLKEFYPIDEDTLMIRGQFVFDGNAKGRLARVEDANITGTMNLQNGYIRHRDIAKPIQDILLDARLTSTEFQIRNASLRAGDNRFEGNGRVRNYMRGTPNLDLKFKASVNLDEIEEFYSLEEFMIAIGGKATADLAVQGPIDDFDKIRFTGGLQLVNMSVSGDSLPKPITALNADLTFSEQDVQLRSFKMQMGDSDFDLQGRLVNWRNMLEEPGGSTPPAVLTATYSSRKLNVDDYVDWEEESTEPLLIELPNLRSTLTARIDSMIIMGMNITRIQGQGETDPKNIRMTSASAQMFDGGVSGRLDWHIQKPDYTIVHFIGKLDNVRAEAFFEEFQMGVKGNFHKYISGGLSADTDYKAAMDGMFDQDTPTILANGTFGIARARLRGHPTQVAIADLLNSPELRDLSMDTWTAQYGIKDGILTLTNMNLTSRDIGLVMNGTQNLIEDRLNYKLQLRLPERYSAKIGAIISQEAVNALKQSDGIVVLPLLLTGTSENPRVVPDMQVVEEMVREYLRQRGTEGLEDAARRLIRGIRGN